MGFLPKLGFHPDSFEVEDEEDGEEMICKVFVENSYDPEETEQVKNSLLAILQSLVTEVEIELVPDVYMYCELYVENSPNTLSALEVCKMKGLPSLPSLPKESQYDHVQVAALSQAIEAGSLDSTLGDASQQDLLNSIHFVALQQEETPVPIVTLCAALPTTWHQELTKKVLRSISGLVKPKSAVFFGMKSKVFDKQEFLRLHTANFDFLADLCLHGVADPGHAASFVRRLLSEATNAILPRHATWAFLLQNLDKLLEKLPQHFGILLPFRSPEISAKQLRILSLNVWFEQRDRELRTAILLSTLRKLGPAICCLQEVTPKVARDIEHAFPSWSSSNLLGLEGEYGVMILASPGLSVRFSCHSLPTDMDRQLLVAEFDGLSVGTVHLESLDNQDVRESQLAVCAEVMEQWPDMILVGDFNFLVEKQARRGLNKLPQFVDLWPSLREEPGNTWRSHGKNKRRNRLDRVLTKLSRWQPVDIELMFEQPQDPGAEILALLPSMQSNSACIHPDVSTHPAYVSDHCGLLATIEQLTSCAVSESHRPGA